MSYWKMVRASYGSLTEWHDAVRKAKRAGWSLSQVNCVLLLWSPLSFLIAFVMIFLAIAAIVAR